MSIRAFFNEYCSCYEHREKQAMFTRIIKRFFINYHNKAADFGVHNGQPTPDDLQIRQLFEFDLKRV